jgi:phosphoribosyl-ATP pyrophosphohydrolase
MARIEELEAENAKLRGDDWTVLVAEAQIEAERAMRKFPQPNYVISKVAEEAGEVVKAAIHCAEGRETYANLRGEMKQTLAMLYRLWVEGDQVHGLSPARTTITELKREDRG